MARSFRNVMLAGLATLALASCKQEEAPSDPRPAAPPQQPAAPAPAPAPTPAQQPAAAPPAEGVQPAAGEAAAAQVSPEAMNEAKQTFATVCSTCHGPKGAGDGPAAAGFPVKPRSFNDAAWQKSVTDDHLRKVILDGGPAVGKSPLMPANPQLKDKPEVVNGLVQLVREFGKQ